MRSAVDSENLGDVGTKPYSTSTGYVLAMQCSRCDAEAVVHIAYSGSHLCADHLCRSVDKRVRRRIRDDQLLPEDARPEDPVRWVVGLSGGKDSAVLATILHETFAEDPRIDLTALTIHEGIEGYRDESLEACVDLVDDLGMQHEVVTYEDEFGIRMDEVAADDTAEMSPCSYCGVFRRDVLSRYAEEYAADLLLTGHNLDDAAQTALMNVLSGDVGQMAKHFEASLAPLNDRTNQSRFIPRAKPLRDIPEKEVALYAHLRDIPAHMHECPHASEAFRGEVQSIIHDLEDGHPGTRHAILAGYEELAELAADARQESDGETTGTCPECGAVTTGDSCRSCQLLRALSVAD